MYKSVRPHPHMPDIIVAHSLFEHLRKEEQLKD